LAGNLNQAVAETVAVRFLPFKPLESMMAERGGFLVSLSMATGCISQAVLLPNVKWFVFNALKAKTHLFCVA
jgi:hypothetical protein